MPHYDTVCWSQFLRQSNDHHSQKTYFSWMGPSSPNSLWSHISWALYLYLLLLSQFSLLGPFIIELGNFFTAVKCPSPIRNNLDYWRNTVSSTKNSCQRGELNPDLLGVKPRLYHWANLPLMKMRGKTGINIFWDILAINKKQQI